MQRDCTFAVPDVKAGGPPDRSRGTDTPSPDGPEIQPVPQYQAFPLLIPEQLRTCQMAKEDVGAAVRKVFQEVQDKIEKVNSRRKVYLSEAMERHSRSNSIRP